MFCSVKTWIFCRFEGELGKKEGGGMGGGVFLKGGWYPNAHYVASKIFQVGQNHVSAFHGKKKRI